MSKHHLPRVLAMLSDVAALHVRLTAFAQELVDDAPDAPSTKIEFPVASSRETSRTPSKDASDPCDGEGSASSADPGLSEGSEEESAAITQDDNEVVSDGPVPAALAGDDPIPSPAERDADEEGLFADVQDDEADFAEVEALIEAVHETMSSPVTDAEPEPAPPPQPAPEPAPKPPVELEDGKMFVIDVRDCWLYGPGGKLQVTRPMAKLLDRMKDGGTYAISTLVEVGEWRSERMLVEHINATQNRLATIGLQIFRPNRIMYRVRRLES